MPLGRTGQLGQFELADPAAGAAGPQRLGEVHSAGWHAGGRRHDSLRGLIELAGRAEQLGFGSIWVGDTLLRPIIEPITMLAAAAAVTERIRLGTAALLPALRRPVAAAQAIASLDQLSGGRVTIAVGAGFPQRSEAEYAASDVPWGGRFARLDDTVALWRQLWRTDGPTSFAGRVLRCDDLPPGTPPVQPGGPPVWLGGAAPAALARTGRHYDGWLPYPPDPAAYASGLAQVRVAAGDRAVTPALYATVLITDDPAAGREALARYALASYRMPLEVVETIQLFLTGPVDQIAARLAAYRGVEHVVCRIGAIGLPAQREQLELLSHLGPSIHSGRSQVDRPFG